jgi:hypothetical protein
VGARRLTIFTSGTSFSLTRRVLTLYGISSDSDDDSAYSSMFIRRVGVFILTDIGVVIHFTCGIDTDIGGADGIGCKGISSLDILVGIGVSFFRPKSLTKAVLNRVSPTLPLLGFSQILYKNIGRVEQAKRSNNNVPNSQKIDT